MLSIIQLSQERAKELLQKEAQIIGSK